MREGGFTFLTNTCHVWAEDGPGPEKIARGWRPVNLEYPAPSAEVIRRRQAEAAEGGSAGPDGRSVPSPATTRPASRVTVASHVRAFAGPVRDRPGRCAPRRRPARRR